MSDEDRDVDIESDEEEEQEDQDVGAQPTPVDKRAHHNALERKRRDHIKDSFHNLRDAVPMVRGEKVSRAQILKKAAEYIVTMRDKNADSQRVAEDMRKSNLHIQNQIRMLEKYTEAHNFSVHTRQQAEIVQREEVEVSETSEEEEKEASEEPCRKKARLSEAS